MVLPWYFSTGVVVALVVATVFLTLRDFALFRGWVLNFQIAALLV